MHILRLYACLFYEFIVEQTPKNAIVCVISKVTFQIRNYFCLYSISLQRKHFISRKYVINVYFMNLRRINYMVYVEFLSQNHIFVRTWKQKQILNSVLNCRGSLLKYLISITETHMLYKCKFYSIMKMYIIYFMLIVFMK